MNVQESFTGQGALLYICSTPIGNLEDVSFRLLEVLRTVDIVAAEDTRHTRKLLTRYDIHPQQLVSYHQHNRAHRAQDLQRWWQEGKTVALVSDAGTPGVSDPGEDAAALAIELGIPVIPVPGPSAVLSALVGSGFPLQPFTFVGFLPREGKQAKTVLASFKTCPGVLVFYEAPHRLRRTLALLSDNLANRQVVLAKELTKRHETFIRGNWLEILSHLEENEPRGEYVIVLGPPLPMETQDTADQLEKEQEGVWQAALAAIQEAISNGISHREAVRTVALQTGLKRKELYNATLRSKELP